MNVTEVRVLPAQDPGDPYTDPAFVLVETWTDADGEPLTTIDYIWNDTAGAKPPWKTVTLGKSVPLSHASALRWAVWFAASRNVPVVYKRD